MDHEDRAALRSAVRLYEETGIGAYTTIQRLADMYVGDGSKREELKELIDKDPRRQKACIEVMVGREYANIVIQFPENVMRKLTHYQKYLSDALYLFIQARLENQHETRDAKSFIQDLVINQTF